MTIHDLVIDKTEYQPSSGTQYSPDTSADPSNTPSIDSELYEDAKAIYGTPYSKPIVTRKSTITNVDEGTVVTEPVSAHKRLGTSATNSTASTGSHHPGPSEVNSAIDRRKLSAQTHHHQSHTNRVETISIGVCPTALRVIGGEIWCCLEDGNIKIYNQQLQSQFHKNILRDRWQTAYDITCLWPKNFAISTDEGLFHITYDSKNLLTKRKIATGYFTSAVFSEFDNKLYVAQTEPNGSAKIAHFEHAGQKWKQLKDIAVTLKPLVTLGAAMDKLFVCSTLNCCIHVLSIPDSFNVIAVIGKKGSGAPGLLMEPRLCSVNDDEVVLLADAGNHIVETVSRDLIWHPEKLHPRIRAPRSVARIKDKLFVTSAEDNSLSLYKLNSGHKHRESKV